MISANRRKAWLGVLVLATIIDIGVAMNKNEKGLGGQISGRLEALSHLLADIVLRRRLPLLIAFGLITVVLGFRAAQLELAPGFDKSLPLRHPYIATYLKYHEQFGGANTVMVALMSRRNSIYEAEFLQILEHATQDISFVKGVNPAIVTSLFTPNVNVIRITEDGFWGGKMTAPDFDFSQRAIDGLRQNVLHSEQVGRIVAKNHSGALIIAELQEIDPSTRKQLDYRKVATELESIRAKYSSNEVTVHIIGYAKFIGDVIAGAKEVALFFVVSVIVTAILLYFYSKSMLISLVSVSVALVAVVWQLGLVELLGYGIDPLSILVPFLLLSIGVSHAVQMTNAWKIEVLKGHDSATAAKIAFEGLFIPGTTALLANAVGFAVIMFIDIEIIHELGITASIGVAVMIITNKFLLPILLSYAGVPKTVSRQRKKTTVSDGSQWRLVAVVTEKKYALVVLLLASSVAVWGWIDGQALIIGDAEPGAPELRRDSRYNRDINTIVKNFNVTTDEITVVAETGKHGCAAFPFMRLVDRFSWHMRNVPGVRSVESIASVVKERNVGSNEGNLRFYGIPRGEAIGTNMRNIEFNQRLFSRDCDAVPIRIYLDDHRAETLARVVREAKYFTMQERVEGVHLRLASGIGGVMAATNEAVAAAEIRMLVSLFVAVGLLCYLTFFSFGATLCVLLPLALVSLVANAVMVHMGVGLKVSTLPVVALGVGVGVDYGIYLFARTQRSLLNGMPLREAFYQGLRQRGTAVVFTGVTMTICVSTWAFSSLKFQADMGLLLAYMFFVNMIGAIVVLPALAAFLVGDKVGKEKCGSESGH